MEDEEEYEYPDKDDDYFVGDKSLEEDEDDVGVPDES